MSTTQEAACTYIYSKRERGREKVCNCRTWKYFHRTEGKQIVKQNIDSCYIKKKHSAVLWQVLGLTATIVTSQILMLSDL